MKLQYLIHGLCFLQAVKAQTAKDEFDAVCDSQNEQIVTLGSGEQFTYICGKTAREGQSNIIDTLQNVGSSGACANFCAAIAECKGSTWNYFLETCVLFKNADDLKTRKRGLFLRRVEKSSSADCTAIQDELKDCEEAEIVLEDDLNTCRIAHATTEKAHTDLKDKLEACDFERDLLEANAASAQECESANTQIGDLNQELEQCKSATLSGALDLHKCQNDAASSALELQQCQSTTSLNALELQQCKNSAASSSLQLQQCQTTASSCASQLQQCQNSASSSALELHQCKSNAASTALELQQCNAAASSSALPTFKDCNTGGNGQILKIGNRNFKQRCNALMWKNQMPLRRVVQPGLSRQECALICALDTGCQSVYFVQSTSTIGECQLQQQNIESRLERGQDIAYIPV